MGRSPCPHESQLKKGPWTPEEDEKLIDYINKHGHGSWRSLPKQAGLNRCGKSCRLRWTNYLRPDVKRGKFSQEEERLIINLHSVLGNKWSTIATHLPGRTDNEIKNVWNTKIRKKLLQIGIDPNTHKPRTDLNHLLNLSQLLGNSTTSPAWNNNIFKLQQQADVATLLAKIQLLHNLLEIINTSTLPNTTHFSGSQILYPLENPPTGLIPGVLTMENNMYSSSSCYDIQTSNPLPELVSASASPSIVNDEMESKSNPLNYSAGSPTFTLLFESWDELMDDETIGSFFDDIPNFTLLSQPPAS